MVGTSKHFSLWPSQMPTQAKPITSVKRKWAFSSRGYSADFSGPTDYSELLQCLEEEWLEILQRQLGVSPPTLTGSGRTLSWEEVFAHVAQSMFKKLHALFEGRAFDKRTALELVNLLADVEYMLSWSTFEAFLEGRADVASWLDKGFKAGKLKTLKQVEVWTRTILRQMKSDTDRNRLKVCVYLWKKYPSAKEQISPQRLYLLSDAMKKDARTFLRRILKGLQKENQIKEVFKRPGVSKARPGLPEHHIVT